ncbi:MAG: hypothetical protein OCD02_07475 [Spirochaetaceae bacterium]
MVVNKHGSFKIEYHGNIILVRFIGAINIDTYKQYNKRIFEIAKSFNGKQWAQVLDFREWGLATPEVLSVAISDQENPEKIKVRCTDQIIIVTNNFIESFTNNISDSKSFVVPEYVKTEEEAFNILQTKDYIGELDVFTRDSETI